MYKYGWSIYKFYIEKKVNYGNINLTIMPISVAIFLKNDASQSKYDY